jgi:hypothetical protein
MDAIERRKVATCDIPGAFLQADWPTDRDCYLKFEGAMVSMICDIDPKYRLLMGIKSQYNFMSMT